MSEKLFPEWLAWPETQALIRAFAGTEFRFVGGCVRDALLKKPVQDVDAATPLAPEATMAIFEKAGIRAIPTGINHGTITAVIDKKHFEITTLRKDVATDGRHAEVEYTGDWKADAARRDFTMNALYLLPSGELFDYFDGVADAQAGHVRFIGDAAARIREDYLRILRFFRFYAWYGKGEPDAAALSACAALASHMEKLSGERIQQEMLKLLAAPEAWRILQIMQKERILDYALGIKVKDVSALARLKEQSPQAQPLDKLVTLLDDVAEYDAVAARLKLPNVMTKQIRQAIIERSRFYPQITLPEQKRLLRRVGPVIFHSAAISTGAQLGLTDISSMSDLPEKWQSPAFPVTGDDLMALGILPGKNMGELLRRLEEKWEESDYTLTKEQLLEMAKTR